MVVENTGEFGLDGWVCGGGGNIGKGWQAESRGEVWFIGGAREGLVDVVHNCWIMWKMVILLWWCTFLGEHGFLGLWLAVLVVQLLGRLISVAGVGWMAAALFVEGFLGALLFVLWGMIG